MQDSDSVLIPSSAVTGGSSSHVLGKRRVNQTQKLIIESTPTTISPPVISTPYLRFLQH